MACVHTAVKLRAVQAQFRQNAAHKRVKFLKCFVVTFSLSGSADTTSQQEVITGIHNGSRHRSSIKRCSAIGARSRKVQLLFSFCNPWICGGDSFTCVFDWLADRHWSPFSVSSCPILCRTIFSECCTALAHSRGVWSTHLLYDSGDLWDSRHQSTCVGEWIPGKDKECAKVRWKPYCGRFML